MHGDDAPFFETADRSDILIGYLKRKHPDVSEEMWKRHIRGNRVHLSGRPEQDGDALIAEGDTIEFVGSSTGGLIEALAQAAGLTPEELAPRLADFLADREDEVFNGATYRDLVAFDRTNLPMSSRTWACLVARIREEPALSDTGADYPILIAAAHVLGPVLVIHSGPTVGLRFHAEDASRSPEAAEGETGYVLAAHPPPGEGWLTLALLEGDHYAFCPLDKMKVTELKKMLDSCEQHGQPNRCARLPLPLRSLLPPRQTPNAPS